MTPTPLQPCCADTLGIPVPCQHGDLTLTPRQREVLHLLAEGRTNKEIAATLGIKALTVKDHIKSIRVRLGVSGGSRVELAALYRKMKHERPRSSDPQQSTP